MLIRAGEVIILLPIPPLASHQSLSSFYSTFFYFEVTSCDLDILR